MNQKKSRYLSRRSFLEKSSVLSGMAYPAMLALNMLPAAPAPAFNLPKTNKHKSVVILGGGLAGLATAYELSRLGYTCKILEARTRSGGRCWSVRKNAANQEVGARKQTATFEDGLYFNAGPSRIPHHHEITLHYCRELGVPLEVYNNVNEAAYYFSEGNGKLSNKKIRMREIHNDMRGYMAELLAKAVDQGQVDMAMSPEDAACVVEYLRAEGGLDIDKAYKATARRGYRQSPGAGDTPGTIDNPHTLLDIIHAGLLEPDFYNVAEYTYELQMTMFQAVGGMDKISQAFESAVADSLELDAQVKRIVNTEQGVEVVYLQGGKEKKEKADLCVCTLPLPILSNLEHNFSSDVSRAIDFASYINTGKIGLQFNRRFWEEDENIYGGITHTNNQLTQIFYPSNDYQSKKGVLIGYYNFNENAVAVGKLSPEAREKLALEKGSLIHPQYPDAFESSFSVSWHLTPYSMGGWAVYNTDTRQRLYKAFLKPDKQVYFAGEHTTYLNAWMAGALASARRAVTAIHARVNEQREAYPSTE